MKLLPVPAASMCESLPRMGCCLAEEKAPRATALACGCRRCARACIGPQATMLATHGRGEAGVRVATNATVVTDRCCIPCRTLQGDVVAISPYQSHLDPRLYPEAPASYNPAREGMQLGAGGSAAQHSAAVPGAGGVPGLSFGGGKYRCPGRFFAEAELALVISLLLLLFDWQLLPREPPAAFPSSGGSGGGGGSSRSAGSQPSSSSQHDAAVSAPGDPAGLLPPPDLLKLVGIKVPAGPCWVQYRRRGSPPQQPA